MRTLFIKFYILFALTILSVLFIYRCEDSVGGNKQIEVDLKKTKGYCHDFEISGDEEGVTIIKQAEHYRESQLYRDSTTNWSEVYCYKPDTNYIGYDEVIFLTCTGGSGGGCNHIDTVVIRFNVTE